ncbi:hypothetical protein [Pseudomonas frederiksbergensis]
MSYVVAAIHLARPGESSAGVAAIADMNFRFFVRYPFDAFYYHGFFP